MTARELLCLAGVSILAAGSSSAQVLDRSFLEEGPITIGHTVSLQSDILSEERRILVSLPYDYAASSKRYPVVYITDPLLFHQFGYASGVIHSLSFIERIPQSILIGVHSDDREMDLTTASAGRGGNADDFARFFREELQDYVDRNYRTEPFSVLIGHSAGGFFALHTLLHHPETFDAYIALDPSVWWDDGRLVDDLKAAQASGKRFDKMLFTSNIRFVDDDADADPADLYYGELVELLTGYMPAGLEFSHRSFPDESHASTVIPGIHQGLLAIYEDWPLHEDVDSVDALLSRYRYLSDKYGYRVEIPFTHASDIGFRLLDGGKPEEALAIFEYALEHISQNEIAWYQLGTALKELGRLTEARAAFDKAIEEGPDSHMYDVFVRFRDQVVQELAP